MKGDLVPAILPCLLSPPATYANVAPPGIPPHPFPDRTGTENASPFQVGRGRVTPRETNGAAVAVHRRRRGAAHPHHAAVRRGERAGARSQTFLLQLILPAPPRPRAAHHRAPREEGRGPRAARLGRARRLLGLPVQVHSGAGDGARRGRQVGGPHRASRAAGSPPRRPPFQSLSYTPHCSPCATSPARPSVRRRQSPVHSANLTHMPPRLRIFERDGAEVVIDECSLELLR